MFNKLRRVFAWSIIYLASSFDGFTKSTTTRLTAESVSDELVLSRVNDEGAIFDILPNAQKAQVANASFNNYLVIVLEEWKSSKINTDGELCFISQKPTPLGRTAIIDGEMDTLTLVQLSGAVSALTFSMASLMVFMPTACWTSQQPRYWALRTFFGSSIGVGKDCAMGEGDTSSSDRFIITLR